MVGRILRRLKQRGLLVEPLRRPLSACQRPRPRPYGVRKPKEYVASRPGDIVQVDTLDLRPLPGEGFGCGSSGLPTPQVGLRRLDSRAPESYLWHRRGQGIGTSLSRVEMGNAG